MIKIRITILIPKSLYDKIKIQQNNNINNNKINNNNNDINNNNKINPGGHFCTISHWCIIPICGLLLLLTVDSPARFFFS